MSIAEMNFANILSMLMNELSNVTSVWIVLAVSVVIFLFSALMMIRGRRKFVKYLHEIRDLQRDIRAITAAAIGVGERVLKIERRQRRLTDRQDQFDVYDSANQPYEQAINMVKHGSDVSELVDVCGISEPEAELVALMHRLDQSARTVATT